MRWGFSAGGALVMALGLTSSADAAPARWLGRVLSTPLRASLGQQQSTLPARETLSIRLSTPPVALGGEMTAIEAEQAEFLSRFDQQPGALRVVARVQRVMNAIFVRANADLVPALVADPRTVHVAPVANYALDLSETVPYIGAAAAQASGANGAGIRVAVLDSGIDYTHANLGGPGTLAGYEAAYGSGPDDPRNTVLDGLFPTPKVVGGYDFVGEVWPNGPNAFGPDDLAPDPDPIDFEGHGSHVADIIGGQAGVAPGAELYAVKICSAVAGSCSGIALIQGMEFAVDPNGDGDPADRVDIINMSLGSNYGQPFDDDLVFAVDNASRFGVVTVASAGNGGDRPYVTGTPAGADTAISVAQTNVPSAAMELLSAGDTVAPAVFQSWSVPLTEPISAPLQYADGAGGNLNGCLPFEPGSLTGRAVIVDRGACNFTLKISNISQAGGVLGIIGLVAPGAAFAGADGGDRPIDIPGYMVNQADALVLQALAAEGANATADPANQLPLIGSMVGSSSRGPTATNRLKPEIGAPGASLSLEVGTGTGETPFGGTSGAAPMVTGSVALLLEARGGQIYEPAGRYSADVSRIVKSLLVNTADEAIDRDITGAPAEVTRIGGGEVRVNRAVDAPAYAYSLEDASPAISLGFVDISAEEVSFARTIAVKNLSARSLSYEPTAVFPQPDDVAAGAVTVQLPERIDLEPNVAKVFTVRWTVDGTKLGGNTMSSGAQGTDPAALTALEYDGYVALTGIGDTPSMHLPWTVIPRKAAAIADGVREVTPSEQAPVEIRNFGVGDAQLEAFTLVAESPDLPQGARGAQAPQPDLAFVGVRADLVEADVCGAEPSFVVSVAINTHERQSHLLPVVPGVQLDLDGDGVDDFALFGADQGVIGTDDPTFEGRVVSWAENLQTEEFSAFFDAEHAMNTGNTVLRACAEQLGMTLEDYETTSVIASAFIDDVYFDGPGDRTEPFPIVFGGEAYDPVLSADTIAYGGSVDLTFSASGASTETTALGTLIVTNSDFGEGARGGATEQSEALILRFAEAEQQRAATALSRRERWKHPQWPRPGPGLMSSARAR